MKRTLFLATVLALATTQSALPVLDLVVPTAEAAKPPPVDAGLAVAVTGEVTYKAKGRAEALTPFQKVRVGDKVTVPDGAMVQLVFFSSGRKETWNGPATVRIAEDAASLEKGDATAEVADVGDNVGKSLESLPVMLRRAELDRAGATLVRGRKHEELALDDVEKKQVEEAEAIYAQMKADAPEGDILPAMFMVSVYLRYALNDQAEALLEEALATCPDCTAPKSLLEWVRAQ